MPSWQQRAYSLIGMGVVEIASHPHVICYATVADTAASVAAELIEGRHTVLSASNSNWDLARAAALQESTLQV